MESDKMSKVVVRTQYFLSGKSVGEKFTNYIAKREGVDKTINTKRSEVFVQYAAERPGVVTVSYTHLTLPTTPYV